MQKIINPLTLIFLLALLTLLTSCSDTELTPEAVIAQESTAPTPEQVTLNNQGAGEMGSFDYDKATSTYEKLLAIDSNWTLAKQNYAIALLNRQKQGDEGKAIAIAEQLSIDDNSNLIAHYIVGILSFNQGLCDKALPRFETIMQVDKVDAYPMYFAGQCHLQNGDIEKSLALYQKAIKADSYLRSAYYGGFMAAQRLEKPELVTKMLNSYQKLASNPKARLAEIKYTRMGPKVNALAYSDKISNQDNIVKILPPYFKSPKPIKIGGIGEIQQFGIVNLQQTAEPQLYVVANNQLKIFETFNTNPIELKSLGIDLKPGKHLFAWGDINNDKNIDVYITGETDQLYLQSDNGFEPVDMNAQGISELNSSAVRLIDADHDGDLDILLLSRVGGFEIWNNNLNGTFTPLSQKISLTTTTNFKKILVEDFDSDRDVDIVLVAENEFVVLLNDRMWNYEEMHSLKFKSKITSANFSDNDNNGMPDLNLLFENKLISFEYDRLLKYYKNTRQIDDFGFKSMLQADINGNGLNENLMLTDDGISVVNDSGKIIEQILLNGVQVFKTVNTIKGSELLALKNNQLQYIAANKNRAPFLLFNVSGKEDDANSVRSNFSGIGSSFIVRNQNFYAIGNSFQNMTGVDQDYQAVSMAAGNNKTIDYIEMEWSDGVYQTELGLETGKYHKITETQRQLSSCPVIFAWNNGKYEFVSDVLGVGGIGFAIGRNEYGVPRPWENYLLSSNQISSQDGVFKLQFTEPMEESAYLDELKVEVIDVPSEYQVLLDERMGILNPPVSGQTLFYKESIKPILAINNSGQDVTQAILDTDKKAIEIDNRDHRFLGLVDEQVITMEFDQELFGKYQFIMNGWIEYGYSQTMFAAWQAGLTAQAPTLEFLVDGQWKVLLNEFGYPAGMPRAASVPINIPEKTTSLRIRTNMEIYFDELALVRVEKPEEIKNYDLELASASLKQLGFPKRRDNHQRVPSYDYSAIQPFWDTRYMEGAYTKLGKITPLLQKHDNALAIIGAGEAIELEYSDNLPELKKGFKRYFILKFKGWAKDMDILTKDGETLAPIPRKGHVARKAQQLNQQYNTRFKAGK